MSKNENSSSVNIGTENKFRIQAKVLNILKTYPKNKTVREYASMLSWDIGVSFRTARENYIQPLIDKGILVHTEYDNYVLNLDHPKLSEESYSPKEEAKKINEIRRKKAENRMVEHEGYCLNCGKEVGKDRKFCNEKCTKEYYDKKKNKGKK